MAATQSVSVDAAINWIIENAGVAAEAVAGPGGEARQPASAQTLLAGALLGDKHTGYKMVLCVRQDLKMRGGKVPAQCVHAALGAYREVMDTRPGTCEIGVVALWGLVRY